MIDTTTDLTTDDNSAIAIIGMAGRFPGAATVDEFWQNLCNEVEAITHFSDEELLRAGVDPALLHDPHYVKAGAILEDVDQFDAAFFGLTPQEARVMDPQHRLFLETASNALEHAGYNPETYQGTIGLYGGSGISTYLLNNLIPEKETLEAVGTLQVVLSNDKDSLTTRVAYLLDLTGPCYTVQTYCSTSLVAVCIACSSLLNGECDMALAGGVAVSIPQKAGYSYQEGGIASPDARCRAFDAEGNGSPLGNGVGMVVLKRLDQALNDGDSIHAIIKGSAINNDGALKVGYTAPGVRGQAQVILEAQANADVQAEDISYIEAHGTGTAIGDVVELTALIKAFRASTTKNNFCAIGSVKTNVGHLDRAAGVTGLIKTTLALKHSLLPATLNYNQPNPQIDLEHSPFFVNTRLTEWKTGSAPRRAGVSAFGIGGTNAHVILEEAPAHSSSPSTRSSHVLLLSARTKQALTTATRNLESYLRSHPELSLADVAYTLQVGRKRYEQRCAFVCHDHADALQKLSAASSDPLQSITSTMAFLFSGNAPLKSTDVAALYAQEPVFRAWVDQCHNLLTTRYSINILDMLLTKNAHAALNSLIPANSRNVQDGQIQFLSGFVVQYALAQMLMTWDITPHALMGYGHGEYIAACLADVFSLEDMLALLVHKTQLSQQQNFTPASIASDALATRIQLHAPRIPFISANTGTWVTSEQAQDLSYWLALSEQATHFSDAASQLLSDTHLVLEVGLDSTILPALAQVPSYYKQPVKALALASNPAADVQSGLLETLGALWVAGVPINWQSFSAHEQRLRVPLPTYPFERQRYWIDPPSLHIQEPSLTGKKTDRADWFYRSNWQQQEALPATDPSQWRAQLPAHGPFLLFLDRQGVGTRLMQELLHEGQIVIGVLPGDQFTRTEEHTYSIRPSVADDYTKLLQLLSTTQTRPETIVYCWGMDSASTLNSANFTAYTEVGLYSLLHLVRALAHSIDDPIRLVVVSNQGQWVTGSEELHPEQAMLPGMCTVITQEHFSIACHAVDIAIPTNTSPDERHTRHLLEAIISDPTGMVTAYRQGQRWTQTFEPVRLEQAPITHSPLRHNGVYLITGGLGNVGLALASYLTEQVQARLVLLSHAQLPPHNEWDLWIKEHGKDDRTSQKILRLQELEDRGAKILLVQADVANEQQMRAAIQRIDEYYGDLHGVIHAAGVTRENAFRAIEEIGPQECEWHFQTKVHGVLTLATLLQGRTLDFCILFSSLSATLGGLGFVAYTAANAFMDAVIQKYNQSSSFPWISINWDTWQFAQEKKGSTPFGQTVAHYAMTPEEGTDALTRILTQKHLHHIIVSTGDLQTRIRQWIQLESLQNKEKNASPVYTTNAQSTQTALPAREEYTRIISTIWQQVLGIDSIGLYDNFFEIGGNSLLGLQVIAKLKKAFHKPVPAVALFEAPTISSLVKYLLPTEEVVQKPAVNTLTQRRQQARKAIDQQGIAIIGMAGRFPGATTLEQFWQNLRNGVESITVFSDEELLEAGVDPALLQTPNYIKARPVLDQVDQFDAPFFGYSPREAALMDPQHRLFMECSWEALEAAGYDPLTYQGLIGIFAGANISTYLLSFAANPEALSAIDDYQIVMGNDKDSLTTSVSYKLNLRGPSFAVQTFCSTSLVATHLACQSLLNGESDIAMAGGVSVRVPTRVGYIYNDGGMESPDGHCRTFDAQARGTLFGDGSGVVVLKRLNEALEDGDPIHAIIKGSAINNDGSLKVSYTAPSVVGQTEVVTTALASAGVAADTISYIEAHGTATELGDPIEMASLTKAFRSHTDKTGYCAIGSVKTNFGHLDRAAGISGLIKTILSLQHGEIPPSLHYQSPNPEIDFEHSPFYVNTQLSPWKQGQTPRRAGINSLGMGGTNAHVILEEAPPLLPSGPPKPYKLLLLSARTATALEKSRLNLLAYLQQHEEALLDDVAYTLQVGRHRFDHRLMLLSTTREQAITALETYDPAQVLQHFDQHSDRPVTFLFPGIGEQYPGMARDLYQHELSFRQIVDTCCSYLLDHHGLDLRPALQLDLPDEHSTFTSSITTTAPARPDLRALLARPTPAATPSHSLTQTLLAQPAVFVIEYALARLLQNWGIHPHALQGYSLGEYVAAAVADVLPLEDALTLVLQRAQLIAQLPTGAMLAVMLSRTEVTPYLAHDLSLAALNGPHTCVVAGTTEAILSLEYQLMRDEIVFRRIEATHPFHSHLLEPVREPLEQLIATMTLQPPKIPYISNVTGTWITSQDVTDPAYWGKHLCQTVHWHQGIETLLQEGEQVLLEVGPGQSLSAFVRQHPACSREQMSWILPILPAAQEKLSSSQVLLTSLGKLWLAGGSLDWQSRAAGQQRKRVVLPTYPFEQQRYWHEGAAQPVRTFGAPNTTPETTLENLKREELAQWFYLPGWKQSMPPSSSSLTSTLEERHCWLLFADTYGIADSLGWRLRHNNQDVITVTPGTQLRRLDATSYTINPTSLDDYEALLKDMVKQGQTPEKFVHLWTVGAPNQADTSSHILEQGLFSLLHLVQASGNSGISACQITVISNEIHDVLGNELIEPEKATVLGTCKVIPLEYPGFTCRNIDLSLSDIDRAHEGVISQLLAELCTETSDSIVALRNQRRWVQTFESIAPHNAKSSPLLRENGVYLITGGQGGIGMAMAEHLAHTVHARLALLSRSELPPEEQWPELLAAQGTTNSTGRKIQQIQQLREAGAEVLVLSADVTDEEQMRAALEQVSKRFGTIHGVLHAAGVPGIGLMQTKTPAMVTSVLAAKVQGTLVLDRLLQAYALDFFVLYSSITSITGGGPGQVDYCAANAFLDAFAHRNATHHGKTLAINWGEWKWNAWEAGLSGYDPQVQDFFRKSRERFGIGFDEGFLALLQALSCPLPQVIVSTQHFPTIVELSKDFSISMLSQKERRSRQSEARHTRPPLANSYVAPDTTLELKIAAVWEEFLGIAGIGIHDSFFELGGHSLIGTQIILRLRQIFSPNISVAMLFESPTIAELATAIEIVLIDEIEALELR